MDVGLRGPVIRRGIVDHRGTVKLSAFTLGPPQCQGMVGYGMLRRPDFALRIQPGIESSLSGPRNCRETLGTVTA